jgi:outer membrane protein assembly factor BamA
VSYAPETRLVIGINFRGLYKTSRSDSTLRSSYASLVVDATQNRQVIVFAKTENLLPGERWRVVGLGGYIQYPITYWGVGPRTPDSAASSIEYTSIRFEASVQRKFAGKWFIGGGYKLTRFWNVQNAPDGTLFAERPLGWQGAWASGPSLNLLHDSRSNLFGAYTGWYLDVTTSYAEPLLGSTYRFGHLLTDFRYYLPVRGKNKDVLAFNLYSETTAGDVPVWHMPAAGGSRLLRGYFRGRYIDRNYLVAQLEYRLSVLKYLGIVGFVAAGAVAPSLSELPQSPLLVAGGGGVRIKINPKENAALRLDVAYGNALQLYLGVFEAF